MNNNSLYIGGLEFLGKVRLGYMAKGPVARG